MKKVCKLLFLTILTVFIVATSMFSIYAENTAYEIDDIKMSISVPDNMLVITRDSIKEDEFFKAFGVDYDDTMSTLASSNIYFEAMKNDSSLTLTVSMTTNTNSKEIESYNSLSAEDLGSIKSSLLNSKAYKSCSIKNFNGITYFVLTENTKVNGKIIRAQQYNTVFNGNNYLITLKAQPGKKLTADDKLLFEEVMKSVSIKKEGFLAKNSELILAITLTVVILAVLIVLLIVFYKYMKNPVRKNRSIIHQLAHEHQISETTFIPRKKLYHLMDETAGEDIDFMKEYEPLMEIGVTEEKVRKEETLKEKIKKNFATIGKTEKQEEYVQTEKTEEVVVSDNDEFEGGTDYFTDVPEKKDMYSYSDVDTAVDDYSAAKRAQAREQRKQSKQPKGKTLHPVLKVLKTIGIGIIKVIQTIFIILWYVIVHCKYFCINVYRLIKRRNALKKRKKIEAERKERTRQRQLQQQEAERRRQRMNENRGENDLIKVRTRGEIRTQSRSSYNRQPANRRRNSNNIKRY